VLLVLLNAVAQLTASVVSMAEYDTLPTVTAAGESVPGLTVYTGKTAHRQCVQMLGAYVLSVEN
jgi:hypothetical protein